MAPTGVWTAPTRVLTPRSCPTLAQLAGQSGVRDGLSGGFWGQKPWSRLAAPTARSERRHGRAAEGQPDSRVSANGKHPPTEQLLLIRCGNDLLLGQGRRVKCFCTPGRYPAFDDGFARTALKVPATEGLKTPPEPRWPEGTPPRHRPRMVPPAAGCGRTGTRVLCPTSFPI